MPISNVLSLLAFKVKPRVFDLSTGLQHVSIRDQIVRAQTLIRDLHEGGQIQPGRELLVVGAGVAGISVALAAQALDMHVLLVEAADLPLTLQQGVTSRFVGPHMYEWPLALHDDQTFPTPHPPMSAWVAPTWAGLDFNHPQPQPADVLASQWLTKLSAAVASGSLPPIRVFVSVVPTALKTELKRAVDTAGRHGPLGSITLKATPWPSGSGPVLVSCQPQFVILAAGFGQERTRVEGVLPGHHLNSLRFWSNDQILHQNAGHPSPPTAVVIGGGDGALQDALRLLTGCQTPLHFIGGLPPQIKAAIDSAIPDLIQVEQQHRLMEIWSGNGTPQQRSALDAMHAAVRSIAQLISQRPGVAQGILAALRSDVARVHLVVRERHFTKAYLLNRFLVLLIEACESQPMARSLTPATACLEIHLEVTFTQKTGSALVFTHAVHGPLPPISAQVVVVRAGLDTKQAFGRFVGLTKKDSRMRSTLSLVPQPFSPVG